MTTAKCTTKQELSPMSVSLYPLHSVVQCDYRKHYEFYDLHVLLIALVKQQYSLSLIEKIKFNFDNIR